MTKLWQLLEHPVTMIGITVLCVVFFISLHKSGNKLQSSSQSLDQMKQEIARLQEQNQALVDDIEDSQTPLAQEKMIRDQLLMQKPGEVIVQLGDAVPTETKTAAESAKSPLESWKSLLLE